MTKAQAEAAHWRIVAEWADGLNLEYAGVALADCAVYPLLSTLGRVWLVEQAEKDKADHDHA